MEQIRRLSVPRSLTLLSTPAFARARPLFELWHNARVDLTEEVHRAVRFSGLARRLVLVLTPAVGARLITQHFGAGIMTIRPCETLLTIEEDFYQHHPDRDYSA